MGIRRARKQSKVVAVMLLSVMLAACGGDNGGEEPTATAPGADAPPTVQATQEVDDAPEESPEDLTETAPPANTDMSTLPSEATPPPSGSEGAMSASAATGSPDVPIAAPAASPVGTMDAVGTPVGPVNEESTATGDAPSLTGTPAPDGEGTQADVDVGDGTTGAVLAGEEGQPPASPEPVSTATPTMASASPEVPAGSATPAALLEVSGCDVENVPPFAGDPSTFTLTTDLNFRAGPGPDCDLALEVPLGEFQQVVVIGGPVVRTEDGSEWVQIQVGETIGWVAFEFLVPVE